ncbi:alpha/beta hydrolase, partial [Klebsiella pneumoniae]|nr:alpha/beta hydrolase [Klebsiella pneumoniae]
GGLTAALTLLARDRQYPSICFQMPLYPMIDDRNNTPSANEIKEGFVWNQKSNEAGWKMYLGSVYGEEVSPYAAPARATDLTGLPPTYTMVGEIDLFRDETIEYANR